MARRRTSRERLNDLRSLGANVARAAKAALKESVDKVVTAAKRNCPVKTGKLRDSIKAERQEGGASYKVTTLFYGRIVEFSPKINKPFLLPALEENRDGLIGNLHEAIRQTLGRH